VPNVSHGLFQPGKQLPNEYSAYAGGPQSMIKNGFVRYWDPVASAPYLYNAASQTFASYDDPESLALKCNYLLAHHLRGIMFWDYESDSSGLLLNAVHDCLGSKSGSQSGTQ
jgi:chitinase